MDLRVLGPVEAAVDDHPVAIGAGKPRALLAMLALSEGSPVSSEALIDGLWGETPPATAPKMVQVYVSQLRKVIGGKRSRPRCGACPTRSPCRCSRPGARTSSPRRPTAARSAGTSGPRRSSACSVAGRRLTRAEWEAFLPRAGLRPGVLNETAGPGVPAAAWPALPGQAMSRRKVVRRARRLTVAT
jgi:hypothetical protein